MDGTIVDSERVAWQAAVRAFKEIHQIDLPEAEWSAFHGQSDLSFFTTTCKHLGIDQIEPVRHHFAKLYLPILAQCPLLPGVREAMQMLSEFGPQAIVSGSMPAQIQCVIDAHNLASFITYTLGCGQYERGKPDPQPFQLAAHALGFEAERCLVLEDSPSGVRSGLSAGMKVIGLRIGNVRPDFPAGKHDVSEAHVQLHSLQDLRRQEIEKLF